MVQPTRTRISADAYYQLPEYAQHDLIELIDGEVVIGMPPIPRHQRIVREILILLALTARQTGGDAYTSPIEVFLDAHNVFEPDVLYLAPDSACTVEEKRLVGPPGLVVEVLSPRTAGHDRDRKYKAYERFGVREYWIVDPVHNTIEVWTNTPAATFARQGAYTMSATFQSVTLGAPVTVKDLLDG